MRSLILLLLGWALGATPSFAQQFRIVTWQVDQLPSGNITNAAGSEKQFTEVAEVLTGTDADVIVLYGVPDVEAARKIAALLKGRKYSAVHHSTFRHGQRGPVAGQPFALLSRRERIASKTVEWTHTGRLDNMAGGFGFAAYRHGPTAVCVYVASLPGSLTNGIGGSDGKYLGRKRTYAAQYLAHHANWLATTFTNPVVASYVAGDFYLTPKGPVTDDSGKIMEGAGFRSLSPGIASDKSLTSITNSAGLDRVQDPIFTKGMEFVASRVINRPAPEHSIVVCDLTFKSATTAAMKLPATRSAPAPVLATATAQVQPVRETALTTEPPLKPIAPALLAPTTSSPKVSPGAEATSKSPQAASNQPWLWWSLLAALGLAVIGLSLQTSTLGRRIRGLFPRKERMASLHLELQPAALDNPPAMETPATLHLLATATGQTDRVPWDQSLVCADNEDAGVRMTPHLKSLMREAVVTWLARQRTHLLQSHDRGTDQILELHARVEKIKLQFQERMQSQQHRIAELDSALRNKEKVILELVRGRRSA